jgi:hypothetical protein
VQEAAKRYDTTAAKTEMARNAINDAAIEIGDVFLPVMAASPRRSPTWPVVRRPAGPDQGVRRRARRGGRCRRLAGGAFLLLFPRIMETYKAFQQLCRRPARVLLRASGRSARPRVSPG